MSSVESCRLCKDNYLDHIVNKNDNYKDSYLQHLGFCSNKCWNMLNKKGKIFTFTFNDLYGDKLKRHKIKIDYKHLLR